MIIVEQCITLVYIACLNLRFKELIIPRQTKVKKKINRIIN